MATPVTAASSASLEWVTVVQDLFLEGAPPARIAAWLDGRITSGEGYVVVRDMRAISGFDATILVDAHGRAKALTVWYRDLAPPSLADAEALLGPAGRHASRLFDLVFADTTRHLDDGGYLVIACSATHDRRPSEERFLVGIALTVMGR